jgi:hypothetical protein
MGMSFLPQGNDEDFKDPEDSYYIHWTYSSAWYVGDAIGVEGLKEYSGSMPTIDLLLKCRSYLQSVRNNPVSEGFDPTDRVENLYKLCRQAIKQKQPTIGWG